MHLCIVAADIYINLLQYDMHHYQAKTMYSKYSWNPYTVLSLYWFTDSLSNICVYERIYAHPLTVTDKHTVHTCDKVRESV